MKLSLVSVAAALLLLPLTTGCGAEGALSKPVVVFPSRTELAQLPDKKVPADAYATSDVVVDAWSFEGAAGAGPIAAPYDDPSPWGALLREVVAPHAPRITASNPLRCAAEEMSRFHLKHGALPAESLRRFIVARCGGTSSRAAATQWVATVPKGTPDEELIAALRKQLTGLMERAFAKGAYGVGLSVLRSEDRVVGVLVASPNDARIDDAPRSVGDDRRVTIRGTAPSDAATIVGLINVGEYGVAHCESDPRVALPRFAITCRLAQGDAFAWVELLSGRKGQVLYSSVADLIVHEGDGSAIQYKTRSAGSPAPVKGAADFTASLVQRLNAVRARAKMPALSLAKRQSAENARLAGNLVDAYTTSDAKAADRIAIGLLAGWDVDGLIRGGSFYFEHVAPTRDATVWLDFALERPAGRSTLLDPDSRQIAVGPAIPDASPALGAAVSTYAMFESPDHRADEARVIAAINAARARKHAPPAARVVGIPALPAAAARILAKGEPTMEALQTALEGTLARTGGRVQGYAFEASDVEQLELPEELLGPGPLKIAVVVSHHKVEGAAWGQYVVLVVVVDSGTTTAPVPAESTSL